MNILVIPTTDWTKHPVPNRLNFIFDIMAEKHNVHVMNFRLKQFIDEKERKTSCYLENATLFNISDPSKYYIFNSLYHLFAIRKVIKKKKIDVIVCANILPVFMSYLIKGKVPVIFDYLDHYEESASTYYPNSFVGKIVKYGVRKIIHFNLKKANAIITVTEEFKDFLRTIGAKNIHVIPNGVDTSVFEVIEKEEAKKELNLQGNILGYVGSLEYWVDLETVIHSLPKLDAKLLIIGPGLFTDYGDRIKNLAREIGVEHKVIFTGRVEYSQLYKYICAMDIGINPLKHVTKNEITVGGKIFNYLACGIPVLSSRMYAVENLLGDNIYYFDDLNSFIKAAEEIFCTEQNKIKYIELAKRFDWKTIENEYEQVLSS